MTVPGGGTNSCVMSRSTEVFAEDIDVCRCRAEN